MSYRYQSVRADSPGTLRSERTQLASPPAPTRLRRRSLSRVLLHYASMLLILGAGWFVGLRPYLHGLAQNQIDTLLSSVVNQLDLAQLPGISFGPLSIPVTERTVNNLFVLYASPSDPVQHVHMQITPGGLRVDFQVYGFACDITGAPVVSNGQLIIANVTVEGIVSLIMSSDEMTSILNAHLRDAGAKLHRNVVGVILKDHEMDIILG